MRSKNLPAVMVFIDFRKAFDSVDRKCLTKILQAYGIPQKRRVKAQKIADAEFVDGIALVTDTVKEADELMREVDEVVMTVGLRMNESKTKYLVENIVCPDRIELVEDFVYLGGRIRNTEHVLIY